MEWRSAAAGENEQLLHDDGESGKGAAEESRDAARCEAYGATVRRHTRRTACAAIGSRRCSALRLPLLHAHSCTM